MLPLMKSHTTAEANQHHPLIITLPRVRVVETSHLLEQEQGICNQNRSGDIKKGDAVRSGRTRTLQRGRTSGRRAEPVLGLVQLLLLYLLPLAVHRPLLQARAHPQFPTQNVQGADDN